MQLEASPSSRDSILLAQLAGLYGAPLRRFFQARLRGGAPDVEDLVQEVFVRLAYRADLQSIEQVEGYVFRTAANVLKDRGRHEATHFASAHDPLETTPELDEEISPERVLLGREAVLQVAAALAELPERTQLIFSLQRFEDLSYGEIAECLGISMSTVEKHMMKAIAHLTRRLDDAS